MISPMGDEATPKDLECLNLTSLSEVVDFKELDYSNCSFWESNPDELLIAPPGEIGP